MNPAKGFNWGDRTILRRLALFSLMLVGRHLSAQSAIPNPILPGDHPDPTIIRIGNTYWTTSTSGDWAPEFPLYRSTDLHHWTAAGAVFTQTPEWARGDFWAPEMVSDGGRVLVYYVGRKRGGPLCVAVATASRPEGPYTDHGPILCQPDGSIDPSFVRDEHGKPFLIWKEDGNSERKPTPIWAQPFTSDLIHLTGEKTQLLVNDPASWEGGVVEGPYIFLHGSRFYLFYAGNACCGVTCNYAEGVARADHLFGPWEKDPANPIIRLNASWKCPGHGTAVETPTGKDYLLYHAYPASGTVYMGRESVLDEITWSHDGWPVINSGNGPSGDLSKLAQNRRQSSFTSSDFQKPFLDPEWKWPIHRAPEFHVGHGHLLLETSANDTAAFIARSPMSVAYVATAGVEPDGGAQAGLGVIGDAWNQLVLARRKGQLELSRVKGANRDVLWQGDVPGDRIVWLRVSSAGHAEAMFSYSLDKRHWTDAGPAASLAGLPPWDQGLRIGLVSDGDPGKHASFTHFSLIGR